MLAPESPTVPSAAATFVRCCSGSGTGEGTGAGAGAGVPDLLGKCNGMRAKPFGETRTAVEAAHIVMVSTLD